RNLLYSSGGFCLREGNGMVGRRNIYLLILIFVAAVTGRSQEAAEKEMPGMQHEGDHQNMPGMDHREMNMPEKPRSFVEVIEQHITSGTSAEPNSTPVPMLMTTKGKWMLM